MLIVGIKGNMPLVGHCLQASPANIKINYCCRKVRSCRSQNEVASLIPPVDKKLWDFLDVYSYFLSKWSSIYAGVPYEDELPFKQRIVNFKGLFDFCMQDAAKAVVYVNVLFSSKMEWVSPVKIRHLWNPMGKFRHKPHKFLVEYIVPLSTQKVFTISGVTESNIDFTNNAVASSRRI